MKYRSRMRVIATTLACLLVLGVLATLWHRQRSNTGEVVSNAKQPLPDFQATQAKAESGDVQAANTLGEMYAGGREGRRDYGEAVKWYRKAADNGLAKAQYNLGVLYEIGQGVPRDESKAAK